MAGCFLFTARLTLSVSLIKRDIVLWCLRNSDCEISMGWITLNGSTFGHLRHFRKLLMWCRQYWYWTTVFFFCKDVTFAVFRTIFFTSVIAKKIEAWILSSVFVRRNICIPSSLRRQHITFDSSLSMSAHCRWSEWKPTCSQSPSCEKVCRNCVTSLLFHCHRYFNRSMFADCRCHGWGWFAIFSRKNWESLSERQNRFFDYFEYLKELTI